MTSSSVYTVNDDDQLAIKKSNETKPMLHLFRLLVEIETTTTNTNTSTNNNKEENRNYKAAAVSSLKSDFLNEVNIIENRIIDYHTLVVHRQQPCALPLGWIALIDKILRMVIMVEVVMYIMPMKLPVRHSGTVQLLLLRVVVVMPHPSLHQLLVATTVGIIIIILKREEEEEVTAISSRRGYSTLSIIIAVVVVVVTAAPSTTIGILTIRSLTI